MKEAIKRLNNHKKKFLLSGDEKHITKQRKLGKLTARERINLLLDKDSFVEIDAFVSDEYVVNQQIADLTYPSEGVVTGFGKINGRIMYIYSQEFAVHGGTLGVAHSKKNMQNYGFS